MSLVYSMMEHFYVGYMVYKSKNIDFSRKSRKFAEKFKRESHRIPSTVQKMKGERGNILFPSHSLRDERTRVEVKR